MYHHFVKNFLRVSEKTLQISLFIYSFHHFIGNYLLSGGLETVLVTWHLESQEKSFLPRLGGGIEHIFQSSDGTTIGVSLSTNSMF